MEVVEENSNNNKSTRKRGGGGEGATLLHTSIAKLSGSSRIIPSHKDFHFYNNFDEFKNPLKQIDDKSKHLLNKIGASEDLLRKPIEFPDDRDVELDDDVVLDWLVDVNDEIFESIDMSLDEFKTVRKQEEETGVRLEHHDHEHEHEHDDGFQVVGKNNKKKKNKVVSLSKNAVEEKMEGVQEVKVATKVKPRIPFHVASIPKPQDEYKIIVNNANQPFEHVWLQRSEDGSRFIHPLENVSVHDFVDRSESVDEPQQPPPIELTPFHFVQDVKDLKQLAIKLRGVNEFAVDLEHNQYRSFQGLTCLMQISTRTEDFVIDTLKLRVHIGPHLRELFKDPAKRKVMHGANSDIVWLQRDFGIYVCNMFDTGQASRVLKMERHSLEYLLNHFCGVAANKEYQNADWRLRPLPEEMIKYAREDTHYLLYIHDLMKTQLLMLPAESDSSDPPLVEVYRRSYDLCTHLYEKELLTENSYLHIYGLHGAELNAQQLAIVSGLCDWRDVVARAEDESTGYVLPNRTLIEIAKHMPLTTSNLRKVLKTKHPYIERNLGSVVSVIRQSIQNAAGFEEAAENLKKKHLEMLDHLMQANEEKALGAKKSEELLPEAPELLKNAEEVGSSMQYDDQLHKVEGSNAKVATNDPDLSFRSSPMNGHEKTGEVMVQVLKKPNRAFGALLGSSAKRKFDPDKREETKLEHIKSTVTLPFHKFLGRDDHSLPDGEETAKKLQVSPDGKETSKKLEVSPGRDTSAPTTGSTLDDIIVLDNESDAEESAKDESEATSNNQLNQTGKDDEEMDEGDGPMSLSDLSSSFQKCLTPADQTKISKGADTSKLSGDLLQVEPFDYETARKEVQFGKGSQRGTTGESGGNNRSKQNKGKKGTTSESGGCEGTSDLLPQGRRRQAFPASGNRTATFR